LLGRPLLRSTPMEAHLTLSCRCIDVIFFGPKGHFVMNKYLYYWTWNLFIILLLHVRMKHPGHTYGGFVPAISEWGMTVTPPWTPINTPLQVEIKITHHTHFVVLHL
jgi:hypothetical protein